MSPDNHARRVGSPALGPGSPRTAAVSAPPGQGAREHPYQAQRGEDAQENKLRLVGEGANRVWGTGE